MMKADLKNINFFKYANFMLEYSIPNKADQTMLENAKKDRCCGWQGLATE